MANGCPRCREWRIKGARFCGDCGKDLTDEASPASPGWSVFPLLCILAVSSIIIIDLLYCILNFTTITESASKLTYSVLIPLGLWDIEIARFSGTAVYVLFAIFLVVIAVSFAITISNFSRTVKQEKESGYEPRGEKSGLSFTSCVFCVSMFLSAAYIILTMMFNNTPDTSWMSGFTNEQMTFMLNRAGVREELMYRVFWIGVPMVVIALIYRRDKMAFRHLLGGFGLSKTAVALVLISSLLFGLAHYDGWGLSKVPDAVLGGIVFGYIYMEYGLHYSILAHVANDTITSIAYIGLGEVGEVAMMMSIMGLGFIIILMWILKPNYSHIDVRKMEVFPEKIESGILDWIRNH